MSSFSVSSCRIQLRQLHGRHPKVVLGKYGEIFVILAGKPKDETYPIDLQKVDEKMKKACDEVPGSPEKKAPRRGRYLQVSTGISYGGGSKVSGSPVKLDSASQPDLPRHQGR